MKVCQALLLLFVLSHPAAAQTIDTMTLRTHTRFLAADALQGRGTGTISERIAAEYIAAQLMRIGVKPAANNSYFQRIPLKRATLVNSIVRYNGATFTSRDFVWNTGGRRAFDKFGGPVTFVGTIDSVAIRRAPEARGKVVVLTTMMAAAARDYVPPLLRAGAAGVVVLTGDTATFGLFARSRGEERYFVDADVNDPVWQQNLPVIIAGPTLSRQLYSRERFSTLPAEFSAETQAAFEDVSSTNVAGIIEGANPRLRPEIVAYSAHYDHLGISTPDARGDSIYNGFSDNAAGVAMLLGIAEQMQRTPPQRSVLFLFFTGEERGLLGSSYYASAPLLPLQRMNALINLDAGAPPAPPSSWRIAGGISSTLGDVAKSVAEANKWTVNLTAAVPNSDYWPFLDRKVPSIFIIPGNEWENTTTAQRDELRQRWDRYHRADDEYSSDFPFRGLQRYAEYAYKVGMSAANAGQKPVMQ